MRLRIRALLHALRKPFPISSLQKGGRRSAERRIYRSPLRRSKTKPASVCGAHQRSCSRNARDQSGGALAFRRPTAVMRRGFYPSTRLGPRFLESPDANGRTLSGASAASTSQSGHAPDGTMPRAARRRSVWLRFRGPLPFHFRKYPRERSLRERDGRECNRYGDECQEIVSKKETIQRRPGRFL